MIKLEIKQKDNNPLIMAYSNRFSDRIRLTCVMGWIVFLNSFVKVTAGSADMYIWDFPRTGADYIVEPAPEATAMRRYQEFPVSYATGTVDVSIPLLSLPGGPVDISLGLSYHTGGIKHDDVSAGIGLGWTLTGLGHVSRQIYGFPDEWKGDQWDPVKHEVRETYSDVNYLRSIIEAKTDAEQDCYFYSFPGYSGSFLISDKGDITLLPKSDLKIERETDKSNNSITNAFIITTPDGIKYRFGEYSYINYTVNQSPRSLPYYKRDYSNARTTWYLTQIKDVWEQNSVEIKYKKLSGWTRTHQQKLIHDNFSYCREYLGIFGDDYSTYRGIYTWGDAALTGTSVSRFDNQLVPSSIVTKSGHISLTVNSRSTDIDLPYTISGMSLYNASGELVKNVTLTNGVTFADGRQRLDGLVTSCDGIVIDRYSFTYRNIPVGFGYDVFGFHNGMGWSDSVLGQYLKLSPERATSEYYLYAGTLETVTDIKGLTTTLKYEPSYIEINRNPIQSDYQDHHVFSGKVIIGLRIKSIKGDFGERNFLYENPMCNISIWDIRDFEFLSYSGDHYVGTQDYSYYIGVAHTSSLNARGVPLENAKIYYGKVTEDYGSIRTVYEYDLSNVKLRGPTGCPNSRPYDYDRKIGFERDDSPYLGDFDSVVGVDSHAKYILNYHSPAGSIDPNYGAEPLLINQTEYEREGYSYSKDGYTYYPVKSIKNYYSTVENSRHLVGMYSESRMFKYRCTYYPGDILNLNDEFDFSSCAIHANAVRVVCDSTVVTKYYRVGDKEYTRRLKTEYINKFIDIPHKPWFAYDSYTWRTSPTYRPSGSITNCGEDEIVNYKIYSCNTCSTIPRLAADRGQRYLPVVDKWIMKTAEGEDSIQVDYMYNLYGTGEQFVQLESELISSNCSPNPCRYYLPDTISFQYFSEYDDRGRVLSMSDGRGRKIEVSWLDMYDNIRQLVMPDVGHVRSFSYKPLTGCTTIEDNAVKVRRYVYKGGRLAEELNYAREPLVTYSYKLVNDGSSDEQENLFTTTVHDDAGHSTTTTRYNTLGLDEITLKDASGGHRLRYVKVWDEYGRLLQEILPVPTDYEIGTGGYEMDAMCYYCTSFPLTRYEYHTQNESRPNRIYRPTMGMCSTGYDKFTYTCNNESDARYSCRRYRLYGGRDSEVVRLDGRYPPGALDVTEVTDPDGCTVLTFTDWRGFTVLERRVLSPDGDFADTYRLYDVRGNERVVIQPEGAARMQGNGSEWTLNDDELYDLAFVYRYDLRGNRVYAKLPGCEPTETRYDRYNRPAFRRTPHLREKKRVECTLYDPIGRVVAVGTVPASGMGDRWDNVPLMTVRDNPDATTGSAWYDYYACDDPVLARLLPSMTVESRNFYDTYDYLNRHQLMYSRLIPADAAINRDYGRGQLTGTARYILGRDADDYNASMSQTIDYDCMSIYSVYRYDIEGRVTGCYSTTSVPFVYSSVETDYSRQGYPLKTVEKVGGYTLVTDNSYDAVGNLDSSVATLQNTYTSHANYHYDEIGRLAGVDYGNIQVDNTYNLRGQLKTVESPLFSQTLFYEDGDTPRYNGNLSAMTLDYGDGRLIERTYTYDAMDRLAELRSTDRCDTRYRYDLNSNPVEILRRGMTSDGTVGIVDYLTMQYRGNRLDDVVDSADKVLLEGSMDYDGTFDRVSYQYDSSGRLTADPSRQIQHISYHPNDRPHEIELYNATKIINYEYDTDGNRLSVKEYTPKLPWATTPATVKRKVYCGSFELTYKLANNKRNVTLSRVNLPWGYFNAAYKPFTYVCDWQGNVRAVADKAGNAVQTTDYYPYGMPMATATGATANPYKYSGKELETAAGINQYDYHARTLPASLPLFTTPDPLAADKPDMSPYVYCNANPCRYIDPFGADTISVKYMENRWTVASTKIVEGNDVFFVTKDGTTETYTFSEGEYGKRVCALNLDTGTDDGIGIGAYHVSGASEGGTGIYAVPGGSASNVVGSGRRIEDGIYPICAPTSGAKWQAPGLGGCVANRGIRFHYGDSNPKSWTRGCFVLYGSEGILDKDVSKTAYEAFCRNLGAVSFFTYKYRPTANPRIGASFINPINYNLVLKTK